MRLKISKWLLTAPLMILVGILGIQKHALSDGHTFTIGATVWDVSSTPFAVPLVKAMRDAADAAGVKLIISDPKWDASVQTENVREFVVQGVDAIGVAPIDVKSHAELRLY